MLWWMALRPVLLPCYLVFHKVQFWGLYCFLSTTIFPPWHLLMDPSWQCMQTTILLYKPCSHPGDYSALQTDTHAIQDCISTNYLTLKFKFLINFVQESNTLSTSNRIPINWLHNTRACSKQSLSSSIGNVEAKLVRSHWTAMYLDQSVIVGMLYRQIYSWADSNTLLLIYCTCIRPHLEYACQIWDPFSNKYSHWKLCKNCLAVSSGGTWTMTVCCKCSAFPTCQFILPHLSVHHEYMHHISYTHVAFVINDMDFFFLILKINTKTGLQQIACTRWS